VAYRADIEIGVKGTRQLEQLRSLITQTTQAYESLNRIAKTRGGLVQNLANYTTQVDRARRAIDNATMGSQAETKAIREYVTAMGQANAVRARQNYLIEQEIANRRKVQATVNAGFGQQGPALPPSMRNAGFGQFGPALPPKTGAAKPKAGIGKGIMGAASNAAIGGAFPLLFGQSGAAAGGGALGGVLGSFLGPSGGFAGSLIGTLIGEKLGQGNQIKELAADIGFSAEQTKMLGIAFQQAGRDFDKFQQSVSTIQGLSLSIEDQAKAIQLASSLTETYKGKIDKVTNAFANALSTGKVTQGTLNQLTNQGIPIQQALADKYNVSRSAIIQMAKDGQISVQDLIDTLVEVGNEGQASAYKQVSAFDTAYNRIETIVKQLQPVFTALFTFISDQLSTALDEVLNTLNNIIIGVETMANFIGPKFEALATTISNSLAKIQIPPWLASFIREGATSMILNAVPGGTGLNFLRQMGQDTNKNAGMYGKYVPGSQQQAIKPKLQSLTAPSQAASSGGSSGAADKAAKAAEREAARVANIVRDRAAATEQLRLQMQYSHGIFVAELAKDPILRAQIEGQQKLGQISIEYSKQINDERAKGNSAAVIEAITKEAIAKTEAEQLATAQELATIEAKRKEDYTNILADLQLEYDLKYATTEEARTQLQIAHEIAKLRQQGLKDDQLANIQRKKQEIAKPKTAYETISSAAGTATDEFTKLINFGNQAITIADAIGTAFSTSFKGIISGTMSAQQALTSFFQSVADAFLDMAAQIIAKWITMTILNSVLKLFPGAGLSAKGGAGFDMGAGINNTGLQTFNPGNAFKFAEGGFVTGPTNALIGEAGQPEYIIPASKMRESMNRYAAGARGASVISGSDSSGTAGGTVTMAPAAIDVRYTVERINSVDYVTADQFRSGMQQAAQQGATQGEQRTLRRLQMSATTRRKVGI
jgi:tape measure domain-containing protein